MADFLKVLMRLGIRKDTRVIVYDHHYGANAAARFWWMLKAIQHEKVQVLDGGFQAAVEKGFPLSTAIPPPQNFTDYACNDWRLPLAHIDQVKEAIADQAYTIVDVRDEKRYNGISEPIDLVAGHIPSAINVPYHLNLAPSGCFKNASDLQQLYGALSKSKVIVHCGSGVTACHTLLAFEIAGLPIPRLYVGSWSEWSRN